MSGITLFAVDPSGDTFEGVNLAKSYLSGRADGINFAQANLGSATLSDLTITTADFTDAILNRSFLPDLRAVVKEKKVVFKGADWWNACMLDNDTQIYDHPSWLDHYFPRKDRKLDSFQC